MHQPRDFQNARPVFDRAAIMHRAWEIVKAGPNWQAHLATRLRYALQDAWAEAKRATVQPLTAVEIQRVKLENKNRLSWQDLQRLGQLGRAA